MKMRSTGCFPTPFSVEHLHGILVCHLVPYQVGMTLRGFLSENSENGKQQHPFVMDLEPLEWIKEKK